MWKVNFTTWTVFTLGQETSIGTIWPGCDLEVSRDSETWGYFSKEPLPFLLAPPPHPLKLPKNVFHVCCIHFTMTCSCGPVLEFSAHCTRIKASQVESFKLGASSEEDHQQRGRKIHSIYVPVWNSKSRLLFLRDERSYSFQWSALGQESDLNFIFSAVTDRLCGSGQVM